MGIKLEKGQGLSDDEFFALMNSAHKRTRHPLYAPTAVTIETAQRYFEICESLSRHVKIGITLQTRFVIKENLKAAEAQIFEIENEYRYFTKCLNYALYKKGSRRAPELNTLLMLPALEGRGFSPYGDKTLHYHVAVGNLPAGLDFIKFRTLVNGLWRKTNVGKDDVQVAPANDEWTKYITKELSCGNVECIDWANASVPYDALNIRSQ